MLKKPFDQSRDRFQRGLPNPKQVKNVPKFEYK